MESTPICLQLCKNTARDKNIIYNLTFLKKKKKKKKKRKEEVEEREREG
jgi:type I restriction-modification system DNA methylase subunit